jgi:5-methylcytosine-specific restriction endonuclease McrA
MAPRLSSLPGRIKAAPSRIGRPPVQGVAPKRNRNTAHWRAWYSTARWQALRLKVFVRDNYTCQRTGALCAGTHPAPDSPTANHKVPHRGNPALFWDEDNIETVTKEVHDTLIQREEQASLHHRGQWD